MGLPKPTFDRVIIQPFMDPEMTKGGIHIPDSVRKKATMGLVVAVGKGKALDEYTTNPHGGSAKERLHLPMSLQVGDTVHYAEYTGHALTSDERHYLVMPEEDVLAFERPEKQE